MKNFQLLCIFTWANNENATNNITFILADGEKLYRADASYKLKIVMGMDCMEDRVDKAHKSLLSVPQILGYEGFVLNESPFTYGKGNRQTGQIKKLPKAVFNNLMTAFGEDDIKPIASVADAEALCESFLSNFWGMLDFYEGLHLEFDEENGCYKPYVDVYHMFGGDRIVVSRKPYIFDDEA